MSAHAHPEHGPVPPSSPNTNLAIPETDPAQIDPKFAGNRSISGPLYSTQKPATQKAGIKDKPETFGRVSGAVNQHNFTQVVNVGTERSLRPEVSNSDNPNQIAAEYILWLAQSYEPSRFKSRLLGGRRVSRLNEDVDAAKLTEVITGSDEAILAPMFARLEKVATDHNTVATINGGAIVGPLMSDRDSVVPAKIQERVSILSEGGLYSKTRRKARKIERDALKTVSHMVGAGSQTVPEVDPRSKVSKAVKKDTISMHHAHHHAQTALYEKIPGKNRRLAFKNAPALIKEVNDLVRTYEHRQREKSDVVESVVRPSSVELSSGSDASTTVNEAERLGALSGALKIKVGGEVFEDAVIVTSGNAKNAKTGEDIRAYIVEYTDAAGIKQTKQVSEARLSAWNAEESDASLKMNIH